MATPITWRNVDAPSNMEAMRGFSLAQNSFDGAFANINKVLADRQAMENANYAAGQENAKQNFLDALQAAKTPEELAALQASGQLDPMKTGMNAATRAAVRGSEEARLTSVRNQVLDANKYGDQMADHSEQPVIQDINARIAGKDWLGAQGAIDNANVRDKAKLQSALSAAMRADLTQGRGDAEYEHKLKMQPYADNAVIRGDESGKLDLAQKKQAADDEQRLRNFETAITKAATDRNTQLTAAKSAISSVIPEAEKTLGITVPRNTDGSINVDRLEKPDKAKLDGFLGGRGLLTTDAIGAGDTQFAASLAANLRSAGARASEIAKLQPIIDAQASSTPTVAIGNDAATIERNARIADLVDQSKLDQFGTVVSAGNDKESYDTAAKVIGERYGKDAWRAETARQAVANFKGIVVKDKDGKPVIDKESGLPYYIKPNETEMSKILDRASTHWWRPGGGGSDSVENALQKWADDPENQKKASQVFNIDMEKRVRNLYKPETREAKK